LFMAALVGSSVSLNIYLVYLFGYPFSGSYCLPPESFVADRIIFKLRKQGLLNKFEEDEIDLEELRKKQGERG
ncbi:MAG: hypothetical protein K8F91_02040, partial [Candidatus Obscuribacterales bacterium]|nr:hypothetical protein [Candidatus Obscuribacterales bacterium]